MRLDGRLEELFAAFSRIGERAFRNDTLLACPTLSKAPNYGNVLRRFIKGIPHTPLRRKDLLRLISRYTAANLGHFLFLLLAKLYTLVLGWKMPEAMQAEQLRNSKKSLVLIDTFALLPQIAHEEEYKEMYLPRLKETALANNMEPVLFFRFYGSRNPLVLWKALAILARLENSMTEVHLYRLQDWFAMVRHIFVFPMALFRLIRSLQAYPASSPEYAIRSALVQTAGQCILLGEARRLAAFRLGMLLAAWHSDLQNTHPPKVISWYENQTVNKEFQRGLRQAEQKTGRHIPVVGMQLFIWPDSLLNNHADDTEAALLLAPDITVVGGSYFLPEKSKQQYVVGPSLRYRYLFGEKARDANKADTLLVLLSYHPEETRRVLETVLPLANSGEKIVYKFHPATSPEFFSTWLPASPVFATGSLHESIKQARGVIGSGSGSLVEAVCFGVPAITVANRQEAKELVLNYLPPFGEGKLWATVQRAGEIPGVLSTLCAFREDARYEDMRSTFQAMLFTEPTDDAIKRLLML